MLKKIGLGFVGLVALLAVVISMQPAEYRVERSERIGAPADVVYAQVSDFNAWKAWNPWLKADPSTKSDVQGEPGEPGHLNTWDGEETGRGSMTILSAKKPERIDFSLVFIEPFEGEARVAFDLKPNDDGTTLTWSMTGENDFVGKAMSLVMDMDAMIGSDYERGLASIKQLAEADARARADAAQVSAQANAEGGRPTE